MNYEQRSNSFMIALGLSAAVHAGLGVLMSRTRSVAESAADMQEVSFLDVTYRPEVARVLSQTQMSGAGGQSEAPPPESPTYASSATIDVPALDMSATMERDPSQAKIDLNRYELDRGGGLDVIRLGGKGSSQTTDEILTQAPIPLARGHQRGTGMGLRGVPGVAQPQPQLSIEHRPLAAPVNRSLPEMPTQTAPAVQAPSASGTSFKIAGPISQRGITKKVKPRYPKWALDQHISGTVVVRIWVLPGGKVKGSPQVVCSSGYPDLDQVVVDALKGWEFAPLESGVKSEDQWGDVTFVFQLS
uniref:Energy transducer TonB n=1 Tax=candidate division WOR-3 bacterium TaxID=2052148 RepID=A0A7C4GFA7_UNCW3